MNEPTEEISNAETEIDRPTEYSINYLKEELNKVVWMYAAQDTTLKEAEELANELLRLFVTNREKHGITGTFGAV